MNYEGKNGKRLVSVESIESLATPSVRDDSMQGKEEAGEETRVI